MNNKGETSEKEDLEYLQQLLKTLDEAVLRLEDYYEKKDYENFDKMRKFLLNLLTKIAEMVE